MRFCHVTTYYPPYHHGGDAVFVQKVCEYLAGLGHEVEVIHCLDAFDLDSYEHPETHQDVTGLVVHGLRNPLGALSPILTHQTGRPMLKHRALQRILEKKFDVVHFHNISLVGGAGLLKLSKAPITLYSVHEFWLFCQASVLWKNGSKPCDKPECFRCALKSRTPPQLWRYSSLVSDALSNVDCLLAPSHFSARRHVEAGIETPIRVFPSFSPFNVVDSGISSGPDDLVLVYVGRLEKSKGIGQLLEAVATRPEFRLKVAGTGNMDEELNRRFGQAENIEFLGSLPHENVRNLLTQGTAAILPSWGPEVYPLSVLEAMSCGVPVIVRRSGGSAEAVEAGGGGWIYDHEHELLPLLDRIARDPQQVKEKREKALDHASNHFGIDLWMQRYFALINELGNAKSAGDS